MSNIKLFYNEEEGNFYFVKTTPKNIVIEWITHYSCDNRELDQTVSFDKKMTVSTCGKNKKHTLTEITDNYILIYPNKAGTPFWLDLATIEHINKEIEDCKKWGVDYTYFKNLIKILTTG